MRLYSTKQIIFIENHHPIVGIKRPWFDDPQLKALGRNLRDLQSRPPLMQAEPEPSQQTVTSSYWETRYDRTPKLAIRINGQADIPRQG
jgi:type IV secretory pathway TraG/TraD family ATPase VirD4